MKNKKLIGIISIIIFAVVIGVVIINPFNSSNDLWDINISFSEPFFSVKEIAEKSDVIVQGKIVSKKKGKAPSIVYTVEVIDSIKGQPAKKIVFGTIKSNKLTEQIEKGEEYVLFLTHYEKNDYKLLSYGQGVNKIKQAGNDVTKIYSIAGENNEELLGITEASVFLESVNKQSYATLKLDDLKKELLELENKAYE